METPILKATETQPKFYRIKDICLLNLYLKSIGILSDSLKLSEMQILNEAIKKKILQLIKDRKYDNKR